MNRNVLTVTMLLSLAAPLWAADPAPETATTPDATSDGADYDPWQRMNRGIFWFNDKLDPATLTSSNIEIKGTNTGVRSGTIAFDPTDSTLIWRADAALPVDTYTVTIRNVRDLRGNLIDGETDGTMTFPEISGNGTPGGNFVTTFSIFTADTTPAAVSTSSFRRHPYNRVLFTLNMNDELDVQSAYTSNIRVRGAQALQKLEKLKGELGGLITRVQGTGLLFSCELAPQFKCYGAGSTEEWLRRRGVNVIHGGENSLRFTPHFGMDEEELDLLVSMVGLALREGPRREQASAA